MAGEGVVDGLLVFEAAALVVVGHLDDGGVVGEDDRAVLGVVGDVPDAGGGADKGLVAVQIVV